MRTMIDRIARVRVVGLSHKPFKLLPSFLVNGSPRPEDSAMGNHLVRQAATGGVKE